MIPVKQRKKIYAQLANDFEKGQQRAGLCYAFKRYYGVSAYNPIELVKEFPEILIVFTSLNDAGDRIKYGYGEIGSLGYGNADEGANIRATLLCFAMVLCNEKNPFNTK